MKDKIICAIDVGSSKIATLIASVGEDGSINLIGAAATPSHGIRKGQIVGIDEAVNAITESVEAAERMAGYSISHSFISIGGPQIESINSHAVVAITPPESEIKENDINRVNEAARAITLPATKEILHVIPRTFTVDGQEGIKDPVGMTGIRLETETHIITGSSTAMKTLAKCISEVGIDISEMVFGGIASSLATLTDTEKELGVILVDIGGETTDVVIFVDGSVSYSTVIPIGARHVTSDIAVGLRVSLESAEKIKMALGKVEKTPVLVDDEKKKEADILDTKPLELDEEIQKISIKSVRDGIIRPRLQEIFKYVGKEIKKSGFGTQTPSGLVISGGGALTVGVLDQAKYVLNFPARIGKVEGMTGLIDEISAPSFATAAGLIIYGATQARQGEMKIQILSRSLPISGMVQKGVDWVKSFLP